MSRTSLFSRMVETLRRAQSPREAFELQQQRAVSRRQVLGYGAAALGAFAGAPLVGCAGGSDWDEPEQGHLGVSRLRASRLSADIGIVGAGIAGLSCAYELKRKGVSATLHEANTRTGGRMWSLSGLFPGQTIERGAELIDTPHKTLLGYAKELKLDLEDVAKPKRDTFYYFDGQLITEATMVDEYRVLVDAMKDDLRSLGNPTADSYSPFDQELDHMSLQEYLESRGAPHSIKKLLNVAYTIEYGVESDRQSCLAFLLFAKASKQSKLRLWGNFSDERYHVVGGNQQIVDGLANALAGQINLGRKLLAVKKTAAGRIELTFSEAGSTVVATHDAVVLALPFNLLREVDIDSSVGLPSSKIYAIENSIYGTNAKLMVGFVGRLWVDVDSNGAAYSDLPYLQTTWEANPSAADSSRGVITDYTGGNLGVALGSLSAQANTENFLNNYDVVYPGAKALARKDANGDYVAHLQHWPTDAFTKGSYTANAPGYFTTIAGNEAKAVENLYFAGETTDSFYSWQGFMEGGALSGVRAMQEILADFT